jgi:hypothetical protein
MVLNFPRLQRLAQRALVGRAVDLSDVSARRWTVSPVAQITCAPALCPDGEMNRIRQLSPYRSRMSEEALVCGGRMELGPTLGYTLRRAHIVDSHLYCGAFEWQVGVGKSDLWLPTVPPEPSLGRATLTSTSTGAQYFGCLLLDDFVLELLAANPEECVSMLSRPSGHEADYRALLGLPPKRVVRRTVVDELTLFIDPAWNASKAERYRQLRAVLRQNVPNPAGTQRLYIRRGLSGQRRVMANEAELEAVLERHGFTVIDPMQLSATEVSRLSLGARVVVSIEGSQISHAQYSMADDATLIILQPPDRFCMQYKEFTDALGMRCGFLVCEPGDAGFTVDIDALLRLLERVPH